MIICKTDMNKVIGGYSSIGHKYTGKGIKSGNGRFVNNNKSESFIFSLTNKDIFYLQDERGAIYQD